MLKILFEISGHYFILELDYQAYYTIISNFWLNLSSSWKNMPWETWNPKITFAGSFLIWDIILTTLTLLSLLTCMATAPTPAVSTRVPCFQMRTTGPRFDTWNLFVFNVYIVYINIIYYIFCVYIIQQSWVYVKKRGGMTEQS